MSVRSGQGRSYHKYHATLCYLLYAEKENSVRNLRCLAANIYLEKRAPGIDLEEKSGAGVPQAVRRCNQSRSGNSCDVNGPGPNRPCRSVRTSHRCGRGRGVLLTGQELVLHIPLPWPVPWRGRSSFASLMARFPWSTSTE